MAFVDTLVSPEICSQPSSSVIAPAVQATCTSTFIESGSPVEIVQKPSHTVFGDTSTLPTVLVAIAKDTIRGTLVDYFTQQCVYESMSTETPTALGTSTLLDLDKLQASLDPEVIHRKIQKQSFRRSLGMVTISTTIVQRPRVDGKR
jgi:hypothetical protein